MCLECLQTLSRGYTGTLTCYLNTTMQPFVDTTCSCAEEGDGSADDLKSACTCGNMEERIYAREERLQRHIAGTVDNYEYVDDCDIWCDEYCNGHNEDCQRCSICNSCNGPCLMINVPACERHGGRNKNYGCISCSVNRNDPWHVNGSCDKDGSKEKNEDESC